MTTTLTMAADLLAPPLRFRSHVELILDGGDRDPGQVMLTDRKRSLTVEQFRRGVRNAAVDLLDRGVTRGRTVALAAPISLEAVLVRYAAGLLGCATVMCPNASDPLRLDDFLLNVGADDLICFPQTAEISRRLGGSAVVERVHCISHVDTDSEPDDFWLALADSEPVPPDSPAVLVTSGGTTGASKASLRSFADWRRAVAAPPCPDRRQLICTPLPYIAQILLDQTLMGGGTVVLLDHFEPAAVLRTIADQQITNVCLVEPRLVELADHEDVLTTDLSSLAAISHIGADAAPSLRRRLLSRLGHCLAHPYGASEAGLIAVLGPDEYRAGADEESGSVGRILPGVRVRIEDEDGCLLAGEQVGRIIVESDGVAQAYAGHRAESPAPGNGEERPAFRPDGWYATGDCGYVDIDGHLFVRGRAKDERIVCGASVFPVDVQEALCALRGVAYAVAVPSSTANGFDAVVVLSAASALTADDLRGSAGDALGINRIVLTDRIPVTEQGKPDRAALQRLITEQ